MFRSWNRFLLKKVPQNGFNRTAASGTHPKKINCFEIASRYLSNQPLSRTMGDYEKRFPSLFHPPPEIKLSPCLPDFVERNPTIITTLPNGLKIASEDAPGPAAAIGIYVDSGSVYENGDYVGATHLLERLAFKSTKNRTHMRIVRDIEATGGNAGASASREQMAYMYDTLKAHIPEAVELLVDCIRNPLFLDSEVEEQVVNVKNEIGDIAAKDPQQFLLESLHVTCYSGALGNPMIASETALQRLDGSVLGKFYFENYTADRIVLAAFGVNHEHLLAIAEPLLYDLKGGLPFCAPKSTYNGGDARFKVDSERTHMVLAFEVPGGWHDDRNATALTVLQGSEFVEKAVDVAVAELLAIATPGQVTQVELDRAKNATKSAILMNLESRAIVAEDIGRQLLTYESRKPVEYFLRCLDELSLEDITVLTQKMLSSPLSMGCLGDVDCVPSYDTIKQRFHASNLR